MRPKKGGYYMPKDVETNAFPLFTGSGFNSLLSYLGNVEKGQPKIYDTPFAKGESTEHLLSSWREILESIQDKWPTLVEFEDDLAKKVGPLSVQLPLDERLDDIVSYYDDILLSSEPIDSVAIKAVLKEFAGLRGLRIRSEQRTVDLMKKSTNSGSPYFTKRRKVVKQTIPITSYGADYDGKTKVYPVLASNHKSATPMAAVIGWRGQEGGPSKEDVKQRVVWMFPFALNIKELQVYQPLIEAVQKLNLVPAWVSMESVDRSITKLFDSKSSNDLVVCTDFSRFDQHFNAHLQDAAQTILGKILAPGQQMWLGEIFPMKYYIPIVIGAHKRPDKVKLFIGPHGMASGSGGTNADETLVHRALQYEAAIRSGARLNPNSQCLGDDGILTYPGITVDDVVRAYSSHGLAMNADKQYASTQDCTYLRRWHHKDYRVDGVCAGVYSTCRALGRLRYLERYQNPQFWDSKAVALRQLSILENVKYHPLKEQFVEFCMKRDKYRLGIDIPGFLDNIERYAKEAIDEMPDFLGYTKTLQNGGNGASGIANWWIVRYLKSM
nr:MAG: RNA-dependent RNA-polymerase [Picobirnavirus sp.]